MTVYVVQEMKGRDLSDAARYGDLQLILPADHVDNDPMLLETKEIIGSKLEPSFKISLWTWFSNPKWENTIEISWFAGRVMTYLPFESLIVPFFLYSILRPSIASCSLLFTVPKRVACCAKVYSENKKNIENTIKSKFLLNIIHCEYKDIFNGQI